MPQPHLIENDDDATVIIDSRIVSGFIAHKERCGNCGGPSVFSLGFWMHFCPNCNIWMGKHCDKAACMHCKYRKQVPLA
jgi:hypothetical protein